MIFDSVQRSGDSFVNPDRVLLWENTRREIREGLAGGRLKAAIVPTGSTEQHNEHMTQSTDFALATLVAQQAALRLYPQVIVSTPCPVGYSPYHMARKGTLTLRKETFLAYVFDVVESLKAHGFGSVLILNGHGGNEDLLGGALPEWRRTLGITLDVQSYFRVYTDEQMVQYVATHREYGARIGHAGEFETSLIMAAFPERVRRMTMEEYDAAGLDYETNFSPDVQEYYRYAFGDDFAERVKDSANSGDRRSEEAALRATAENGQALLSIAIEAIAAKVQSMIDATEAGDTWPPAGETPAT